MDGEDENLLLHPLILPQPELNCSLSKDHLSFWEEATSSENVRIDQPSEKPLWDPVVNSLLQGDRTNDGLPSDIEFLHGDFIPKIRLSEICLNNWCPAEHWACLEGVEFGGTAGVWEDNGSAIGIEKDEGMVGENEILGATDSGDSAAFFSSAESLFAWDISDNDAAESAPITS